MTQTAEILEALPPAQVRPSGLERFDLAVTATPLVINWNRDAVSALLGKHITAGAWHGLIFSKKVKDDRVAKLEPLVEKAMKDPAVIEKFNKIGLSADYLPAGDFGKLIQSSSDLVDEVLAGRKSLD